MAAALGPSVGAAVGLVVPTEASLVAEPAESAMGGAAAVVLAAVPAAVCVAMAGPCVGVVDGTASPLLCLDALVAPIATDVVVAAPVPSVADAVPHSMPRRAITARDLSIGSARDLATTNPPTYCRRLSTASANPPTYCRRLSTASAKTANSLRVCLWAWWVALEGRTYPRLCFRPSHSGGGTELAWCRLVVASLQLRRRREQSQQQLLAHPSAIQQPQHPLQPQALAQKHLAVVARHSLRHYGAMSVATRGLSGASDGEMQRRSQWH